MMPEKSKYDLDAFGTAMIKDCALVTWQDKIWGAWKVLTGEAGIVLVRIKPKDMFPKDLEEHFKKHPEKFEVYKPSFEIPKERNQCLVEKIYGVIDALPGSEEKLQFYDKEFLVHAIMDLIESEGRDDGRAGRKHNPDN